MTKPRNELKSPFPYFGSKYRITNLVWKAFGEIENYIEPFAGSLAVLLANPNIPKVETVNDIDCYVSNFWRALANDPEKVAYYADNPVNEADMHARHRWLVGHNTEEWRTKMHSDPDFYDSKVAGWWVWGMSVSIGDSWLKTKGLNSKPILTSAGQGVMKTSYNIEEKFLKLSARLKKVRVCSGDWKRITTPSVILKCKAMSTNGIAGIFLDPPYSKNRDLVYVNDDKNVFNDVMNWAIENGSNEKMRIILCGYDDGYKFPDNWNKVSWKANGGFGNLGDDRGRENSHKETIWLSPSCLAVSEADL